MGGPIQDKTGMYVLQRGTRILIRTPAKLNLFLEIRCKRSDGFHELETLMTPINIFDRLEFIPREDLEIDFSCEWAAGYREQVATSSHTSSLGLGDLPQGMDNIVVKAVELIRERSGCQQGASVRLAKTIPSAAGLGGASSDAAAALVAANRAWNLGWTRQQLHPLAAELGSDVPFFLAQGAVVCKGRGENLEPLEAAPPLALVVVRPPVGLSTAAVFKHCQPNPSPRGCEAIAASLQTGDASRVGQQLVNDLQKPAASMCPWIDRLAAEFEKQDCYGHQMSGSGTCYFGIARNVKHARIIASRLRARRLGHVWRSSTL
jgi:4-diphosphocytidyl-2-C-methyl-D-erythritol kinase